MSATIVPAAQLDRAAAVLSRGGLVVFPTETFYGLAVCATDAAAVARLVAFKGRDPSSPLPLIAATRQEVSRLFELPGPLALLAAELWPGPLTLAARPRRDLHPALLAPDGTAGVRVSSHPTAAALAAAAGGLITATSANTKGAPPPSRLTQLAPPLLEAVDLVLDGGDTAGGAPSTVVALTATGIQVLRHGAIDEGAIQHALQKGHNARR